MKNLKHLVAAAFTAVAIFIGADANAQSTPKNKLRFGIGVEGLAPIGRLHDVSNVGVGITPRLQYGVADNLALTLTSGYYNYFGKTTDAGVKFKSYGMIPVKAGIKAFVSQNFYLSGELGAGFETSAFGDIKEPVETDFATNTKFIASPGIGWANQSWDVGVRYEHYSGQNNNLGTLGLRIAYGFGL